MLDQLAPHLSPAQYACLQAVQEHGGNIAHAAASLNRDERNFRRLLNRARDAMARAGYSPDHDLTKPVAPGFKLARHSQYYDADGLPRNKWVIQTPDAKQQEQAMRAAIAAMAEEIPRESAVKQHAVTTSDDLLNLYVLTDYHLGMLAWGEETGDDWDLSIAEDLLVRWFARAIETSPPAKVGYFAQLGDFLHFDGLAAVTPNSGHVLDADTRYQKIVRVAIRSIRRVMRMLLAKHEHVHVLMADANHDPAGGCWLREFTSALYEDEPRVTVDCTPDTYYCYQHGATALFFHHGHKRKVSELSKVFAAKYRKIFGATKYAFGHLGHLHHIDVKEDALMVVEQHRTLAAHDAYATRGGWISGRSAQVITYSKRSGEVGRVTVTPEQVQ